MNRTLRIALSVFTLAGLSSLAFAHEAGPVDPACADKRAAFHEKKLERFDLDKDGKLSDAERAQMRAQMHARKELRRAEMRQRYDANKDGVLDEGERAAMRAEHVQRFFGRLDVDKNGQLSVEEVRCTPLARQFAALDLDRSGTLSVAELAAARPMHRGFRHHGHEDASRRVMKKRVVPV